jgi:hypothetical protein
LIAALSSLRQLELKMSIGSRDDATPTFSDGLMRRIRDVKRLSVTIDPTTIDVVIANLTFLHDAVVASERLLIDAAAQAEALPRSAFHDNLAWYYRSHLEEERGHVTWLRDDLKSAGVAPGVPDRLAMAMVGTQYYLLKHVHPAALLGYLAVTEGDPTPIEAVEAQELLHGEKLMRFVRFHAVKDLDHRKEVFELINLAPAQLHSVISHSAENVLEYLVQAASSWKLSKGRSIDARVPQSAPRSSANGHQRSDP